jgi:four helix bundle protein
MHKPPSSESQRFVRLSSNLVEHSVHVAELSRPLVEAIQRKDRDLASQVRRAVNSVALNVAEAHGSGAGNSRVRFESALGSLYEARAGLRLALAWGYFSQRAATAALSSLESLGARLYGMTRR